MADHSVSTVLSLSLHSSPGISLSQTRKPGVDLCPSVWCFNADQKSPVSLSALPNLQEFTFTLLSTSKPSSDLHLFPVPAKFEDFLEDKVPSMKRKREKIGGAKKQRVEGGGHWIKKRLSLSDVNDSSRLLLGKEDVRKYILPLMDEERRAACESRGGLRVKIWDLDTISEHELSLKQWKTGSFLLTSNWSMEFVKRRNLQEGDGIGLMWDSEKLGFFFHKLNAQS